MAGDPAIDRDPDDLRQPTLRLDVAGHQLEVVVRIDGEFWTEWEGESYSSTTFKDLRAKMTKVIRTDLKRCQIPVLLVTYSDQLEPITLIGLHAGNDNLLYVDADGKTHQERSTSRMVPVLSAAEIAEYEALKAAERDAITARRAWIKTRVVNPIRLIRAALKLPPVKCDNLHSGRACADPKCHQRVEDVFDDD